MKSTDYQTIRYLISNGASKIEDIANSQNVSIKTMTKYLRELDVELGSAANIKLNDNRYYIDIIDNQKFARIQSGYLKTSIDNNDIRRRQAALIFYLAQNKSYITIDDLAELLHVSRGTLSNDLKQIQNIIDFYEVSIESSPNNGVKFQYKYTSDLIMLVVNETYNYFQNKFLLQKELEDNVIAFCNALKVSDSSSILLIKVIKVTIFFKKNGYHIEKLNSRYADLLSDDQILTQILNEIENHEPLKFSWTERAFLNFPLNIYSSSLLSRQKLEAQVRENHQLFTMITTKLEQSFKIGINYTEFYTHIQYHFVFLINRAIFHISPSDYMTDKMIARFPVAADLSLLAISIMEKTLHLKLASAENNYLTVYFQLELEELRSGKKSKNNVAYVGSLGNSIRTYLQNQLQAMFDAPVYIDIYNDEVELVNASKRYVIIITDRPLAIKFETPVVMVGDIFRDDAFEAKVKTSIAEVAIDQGLIEIKSSQIKAISNKNWFANIAPLVQIDINDGELTQEFMNNLRNRERQSPAIFENGLAIPHTVDKSGKRRILWHIGVLDKPIKYNEKVVRYIILIAIPNHLDDEMMRILLLVYDLIFIISKNPAIYNNLQDFDPTKMPLHQLTKGV